MSLYYRKTTNALISVRSHFGSSLAFRMELDDNEGLRAIVLAGHAGRRGRGQGKGRGRPRGRGRAAALAPLVGDVVPLADDNADNNLVGADAGMHAIVVAGHAVGRSYEQRSWQLMQHTAHCRNEKRLEKNRRGNCQASLRRGQGGGSCHSASIPRPFVWFIPPSWPEALHRGESHSHIAARISFHRAWGRGHCGISSGSSIHLSLSSASAPTGVRR